MDAIQSPPKAPHEMTQAEFAKTVTIKPSGRDSYVVLPDGTRWLVPGTRSKKRGIELTHKALVIIAFSQGRPVPTHVLAEYPSLQEDRTP